MQNTLSFFDTMMAAISFAEAGEFETARTFLANGSDHARSSEAASGEHGQLSALQQGIVG